MRMLIDNVYDHFPSLSHTGILQSSTTGSLNSDDRSLCKFTGSELQSHLQADQSPCDEANAVIHKVKTLSAAQELHSRAKHC
jgi:hypothetical protein